MKTRLNLFTRIFKRLHLLTADLRNNWRLKQLTRQVSQSVPQSKYKQPIVFFNASTRLGRISLNAAFSLLASWGFRVEGVRVVHFVCQAGMSRCVLGTNPNDHTAAPPCDTCTAFSNRIYAQAETFRFSYQADVVLVKEISNLGIEALSAFDHQGQPLGKLVLPSLRWALRIHHLKDDHATRFLMREYILSAHRVGQEFAAFLDKIDPLAIIVFNGIMFPEATVRWVAQQRGLRVITHEVSIRPFSAFFTRGEATAYPIDIPSEFELSESQNVKLDAYLEQRFQGNFTMAGIRFWPEMQNLDAGILDKIAQFDQLVPIFTNVISDTSQVHANIIFPHMFAWLDQILEIINSHPETFFVIRAHPDEMRPEKESRENVRQWVKKNKVEDLPNVLFFDSQVYISSYELIQRAKFIMVYNSSIGLEASIMGAVVLSGGNARYSNYSTGYLPQTSAEHQKQAEAFLDLEKIDIPPSFQSNSRRFMYHHLYRSSILFSEYLERHPYKGYVKLKSFPVKLLSKDHSEPMKIILSGVLDSGKFDRRN